MKRFLAFLIIVMIAGAAFAQENWEGNRKMAVIVNPNPLILGTLLGGFGLEAGFEFAPIQPASVKANVYYVGFNPAGWIDVRGVDNNVYMLRFSLEGRWYPSQRYVQGFFLKGGLQYHRLAADLNYDLIYMEEDDSSVGVKGSLNTVGIFAGLGYKAVFGSGRPAFSLEPNFDFAWPLFSDIPFGGMNSIASNYLGWILGVKMFRFGLLLGVAF